MYTKTTTAVLMALFSTTYAADRDTINKFSPAQCEGVAEAALYGDNGDGTDVANAAITNEATCFDAAKTFSAAAGNEAKKYCAQWVEGNNDDPAFVGNCYMTVKADGSFSAKTVALDTDFTPVATAASAHFLLNGKFQDNQQDGSAAAAAGGAAPAGSSLPASVDTPARSCTCTVPLTCVETAKVPEVLVDTTETDKDGVLLKGADGNTKQVPDMECKTPDVKTVCSSGKYTTNWVQTTYVDKTKADAALKVCADRDAADQAAALKADPKYKAPVIPPACDSPDLALTTFTECPAGQDVPLDMAPAAPGSFKGYTNRWTFSLVGGEDKFFDTRTEFKDLKDKKVVYSGNQSTNMNPFTDSAQMGAIIGFAVFGLGIIYAIIMIALDMKKRLAMYEEMIVDDLAVMQKLGMGSRMAEFDRELTERLAGAKGDVGADDQLITQALELRAEEYAQYM